MHLLHVKESSERLKDPVEDSLAVLAVQFKVIYNLFNSKYETT